MLNRLLQRRSMFVIIREDALRLSLLVCGLCSDVAEWHAPTAGMFLWMKLRGVADTQQLIMEKALEKEVNTQQHTLTHTAVLLKPPYWVKLRPAALY